MASRCAIAACPMTFTHPEEALPAFHGPLVFAQMFRTMQDYPGRGTDAGLRSIIETTATARL